MPDQKPLVDDTTEWKRTLLSFAGEVAEGLAMSGAVDELPADGPRFPGYQLGAAGVASFLVQMGRAVEEPQFFAAANRWLEASAKLARDKGFGSQGSSYEIDGCQKALFVGQSGIDWVRADLADAMGDVVARNAALARLVESLRFALDEQPALDLVGGLAAQLEVVSECRRRFTDLTAEDKTQLDDVGTATLNAILGRLDEAAILHERGHVGFAHGWVGIIWAALPWAPRHVGIVDALATIDSLREIDGDISYWRGILPSGSELGHSWCNGVAGMTRLFIRAYDAGPSPSRRRALEAGVISLAAADSAHASLCCGFAGMALTLHDAGESLGEQGAVRSVAHSFFQDAMQAAGSLSPRLFIGKAGVGSAALALANPTVPRPLGFGR